jgi:hypothetical protein
MRPEASSPGHLRPGNKSGAARAVASDAFNQEPPALVMPGPEPQGSVSQHPRVAALGRAGQRTGQRGRHDVPAAPADAGAYHAGTGPILMGRINTFLADHLPIRTSA